jgi:Zn-dependent protease
LEEGVETADARLFGMGLMFGSVQSTPYDLRFRLFGIPVNVTPWFWLGGLILGWSLADRGRFDLLALFIASLFVSILVHEMGHALLAKRYGWPPEIFLFQFGGVAIFQPGYGYTTARSILISFAGPGAGFLLYGLVVVVQTALMSSNWFSTLSDAGRERVLNTLFFLEVINLYWGLVNLLPVLPLDGGRISEAILARVRPWDGRSLAVKIGIVVSALVALYFVQEQRFLAAMFFGLICFSNVQMLQQRSPW